MRKFKKISFEVIFFLAVLFCFGINTYSHTYSHSFIVEHSSGTNCVENSFMSDIDPVEDDQIIKSDDFCLVSKPVGRIPIVQDCYTIHTFSWSVWQPPKIS